MCFPVFSYICLAYFFTICTFSTILLYPYRSSFTSFQLLALYPIQDTKETRLASLARKGAIIPSSLVTFEENVKRKGAMFFWQYRVLRT